MATILASIPGGVEATSATQVRWQEAMRSAVRSGRELLELLGLPESVHSDGAERDFPVFVPREFIARMRPGDPRDPLLRQVLASPEEVSLAWSDGGLVDPVGDHAATRNPGLLQKYTGRALLITSGACAVHCRYCFRRHYPYSTAPKGPSGWLPSLETIRQDSAVEEVILSGGDPLSVADSQLQWLVNELNQIEHIRRIRVHTRVPVVIPQRVCAELLAWVQSSRAAMYFVLHVNHPHEIDVNFSNAMRSLRASGATLLNQAVLLRGVNDTPAIQLELCRALVNLQVLPYYLHHLDRVSGALHFESTLALGHEIIEHLRNHLPGYAVPKFVREEAGKASKTPL
jgi:EF-P beta-lysylation protein EpmB